MDFIRESPKFNYTRQVLGIFNVSIAGLSEAIPNQIVYYRATQVWELVDFAKTIDIFQRSHRTFH